MVRRGLRFQSGRGLSKERRTPGLPRGSSERLTLTGRRCRLDRVQHAMTRDRVFKGRAELRSLAIVVGETRVRLRDVGARALRRRPPILLRHGNVLERGLCALAAADVQLPDLGLAAGGGELQIALAAVDLPEQVRAARDAAAIVDREGRRDRPASNAR